MERQAVVQYLALFVLTVSTLGGDSVFAKEKKPLPIAHTTRNIEGGNLRGEI